MSSAGAVTTGVLGAVRRCDCPVLDALVAIVVESSKEMDMSAAEPGVTAFADDVAVTLVHLVGDPVLPNGFASFYNNIIELLYTSILRHSIGTYRYRLPGHCLLLLFELHILRHY